MNFVYDFIEGKVEESDLNNYIKVWYKIKKNNNITLLEYLGMSIIEYSYWVKFNKLPTNILQKRKINQSINQENENDEEL